MTKETPPQNNFSFDQAVNAADSASALVNQYVVSPIVGMGLAGFVFDIEDETAIDLESDSTDHYTENNIAKQDNIALKPNIITLRGYVGELVYRQEEPKSKIQELTEKISTINAFVPLVTASASQLKNAISGENKTTKDYFAGGVASGVDIFQTFKTLNPPKTEQAKAFNFFKSLWSGRQLVSLETPYSFFKNMSIQSIKAIQSGDNKEVTDFTVTLKEMRFAVSKIVKFDPTKYQGRSKGEISDAKDSGKTDGKKITTKEKDKNVSLFKGWFSSNS